MLHTFYCGQGVPTVVATRFPQSKGSGDLLLAPQGCPIWRETGIPRSVCLLVFHILRILSTGACNIHGRQSPHRLNSILTSFNPPNYFPSQWVPQIYLRQNPLITVPRAVAASTCLQMAFPLCCTPGALLEGMRKQQCGLGSQFQAVSFVILLPGSNSSLGGNSKSKWSKVLTQAILPMTGDAATSSWC